MFRRTNTKHANEWDLSNEHPALDLDDTQPLPPELGELSSLPPEYQVPVRQSFIRRLRDATTGMPRSDLTWLIPKQAPVARLSSFISYIESCKPNEVAWLYSRYREMIFSVLYDAFAKHIEHLNALPERFLSPASRPLQELWEPITCLHQLMEFVPRLLATGWRRSQIESIMVVTLDHGNNTAVRSLGLYTLGLYMTALNGKYPESITNLYASVISLRAFSYVDMPHASQVAGDIMCAISSGVDVPDIGCGQQPIVAFTPGRASICPVLQDSAYPINPQGIAALRMIKHALSYTTYLASLLPDAQAAYVEYCRFGLIGPKKARHRFEANLSSQSTRFPPLLPMMALSGNEIQSSLRALARMFRRKYLSWIYPYEKDASKRRHVRRVPILGLRVFVNYLLECLVPQHACMVSEQFYMPNASKRSGGGQPDPPSSSSAGISAGRTSKASGHSEATRCIGRMISRSYDVLRHAVLDRDTKTACFFIDILRLSLQCLPGITPHHAMPDNDSLAKEQLLKASYDVCLGALTVVRLWMASKEEHRPVHLLPDSENPKKLEAILTDYLKPVHLLLVFLVDEEAWDERKLDLLYNALLVHRAVMQLYRKHMSQKTVLRLVESLQGIVQSFLTKDPKHSGEQLDKTSPSNRALTMLTECLVSSWLVCGASVSDIAAQCQRFYSTPTTWLCHLEIWGNVLKSLTIARGWHMLSIDERILIHETMFSGQRQKKGMSKVDEYIEQLRDKSFHLKPIEFSDKDAFATATPFNITSNLMWETMRTVFSSTRRSAQAAKLNRSACKRTIHGDDEAPADSSLEDQSTLSFRIECDIYTQVCHSLPGNLHQMSDSLSKDAPAKMAGRAITQSRTRSGTQSQVPSETQKPARKQRSHERPRRATRPAQPQPLAESSEESSLSTRMWRRILTPLPKRHSERRKLGSSEAKTPPPSSSRHSHRHSHRRSHKGSRSNDDQHDSAYHAAPLPGSMASSELSRERMPQRERAGSNLASSSTADRSSSASDSSLSVRSAIAKTGVIGPAQFESGGPRRTTVFRYTQQQLRNAVRGTDTDTQKSEVAVLNRKAAVELMDCILERVWQFGALWEDLHIGEFLNVQPNSVEDLCHMWLVWVNLLGSPLEAERHRSEIILHGIVQCWDVYRAVLDCSRSRIDNDNVLLNTAWWIIETATNFSASDDRGHIAQTAIFRMGCRGLEHLSSKFLRLHSCFFQTVLIALSPLARGLRFNTSQIKTFFTECRSLISIGNPGVHLTLLSLDMALRRLFLKGSTLDGPIPEPAIQGAATLLVSMSTLLSSDRVINANHTHPKIRLLTDSNMVETLEGTDRLADIVDELPKAKYPIIYDPLGERNYFVSWEEGGPIFGRSCETLWIMLAQPNILGSFAQSCQSHVEQTAVAGLAVICFTELKIANKSLQNSRLIDNCLTAIVSRLFSVQRDTVRAVTAILHFFVIGQADIIGFLGDERARFLTLGIMKATVEQFDRCAGNFMIDDALTIWDLARLLNALLITAPNLITKERPDGEGTQGESIRDFLVEKIMKCCAHPPQSKDAASHQYNQQLVWRQTNKGVVLSLEHAHHTSPPSDNSDASSGHASDSGHSSALALDNIKQVGEILYINLLLRFDEDDRFQYQGAPGSGFERTHIDPYTEESLDSDQLFIYGHGNNILTLHNEGNSEYCKAVCRGAVGKYALRVHFTHEFGGISLHKVHSVTGHPIRVPYSIISDFEDMYPECHGCSRVAIISRLTSKDIIASSSAPGSALKAATQRSFSSSRNSAMADSSERLFEKIDQFLQEEEQAEQAATDDGASFSSEAGSEAEHEAGRAPNKGGARRSGSSSSPGQATEDSRESRKAGVRQIDLFREIYQHKSVLDTQSAKVNYYLPLVKSESLYRDIAALDRIYARDTAKVALLYVGPGQWTETEILSNSAADTSRSYRSFVDSLGWQIDLATFPGFTGKLGADASDGKTCPYFADKTTELVFHEASAMPPDPKDPRQMTKKRHIGNDHVHVIWNESRHSYRPETISGAFGNVQIQIRPLGTGQYGIGIFCDDRIKPFGPLVDGMVVSTDVLPSAVRATAISGHRRSIEAIFKPFSHPYVIRQQSINQIIEKHMDHGWLDALTQKDV